MASSPEQAALALWRSGRGAEAEAALRALLAGEPRRASAVHLLGFIVAARDPAAGLALLGEALALAPDDAAILDNRAQVLLRAGRVDEAVRDLRRAVALAPRMPEAWLHLSQALRRARLAAEALAAAERALALAPDHVGIGYQVGLLHLEAGDYAAAERRLRAVLAREPRHAPAHNNLGVALREMGRGDEALASFERAAAADPGNAFALNNLGLSLQRAGRGAEAEARYARAVELLPGFAQALVNWGNALRERGALAEARARYDAALAVEPAYPDALVNRASLALDAGDAPLATTLYHRALAARPGFAEAELGLAQVALRERRFAAGWDGYERRFDTVPPQATRRGLPLPRLTRASLASARRIAVWSEQGIGDQILFSSLLPELAAGGAAVVAEVDPRLLAMYQRSVPGIEFTTPPAGAAAFAGCDLEIAAGSLPGILRRELADFARQPRGFLRADAARVAEYRARLGAGRCVAVSWRSPQKGARRELGERKSIPLAHFAALAAAGVRLVDVQYGDVAEERAAFERAHPGLLVRIAGLDTFSDLEGVAAAIAACGRVVTCSNVTAHVAGALGVPTQLLYLRGWPPFSYWVPGPAGGSLWHPTVALPDAGWERWEDAFAEVAARLRAD